MDKENNNNNNTAFTAIEDRFKGIAEISKELKKVGLEHCGLIFGIDYTLSNDTQGKRTFGERSLHDTSPAIVNPYQEIICTLGEILEPFNDSESIFAYGFGHSNMEKEPFFPLRKEGNCEGFMEVLEVYNEVTPTVKLGAPTLFAPLINEAIRIVKETKKYHILVIATDGQVRDTKATSAAIVEASNYPLSIITVGVGDGPFDTMIHFDDELPSRQFDNFQFVDVSKVKSESRNPQADIALATLMEIPDQYAFIVEHGLLDKVND